MSRVSGTAAVHHAAPKINVKTELADLQQKLWKQVTSGKMTKLDKPPAGYQNPSANFSITPRGLMDFGGSASVINGKLYVDTVNFAGRATWYSAPTSDLKKLQVLERDMYAAANKVPASKWTNKAPEGAQYMTRLNITPQGLLGVGTTALLASDGSVYAERRVVAPHAKPSYAKIG